MVLFSNFGKTVKDLFKKDKYELNRTVSVKNTSGSSEWTTEVGFPVNEEGKSNAKVVVKNEDKKFGTCEFEFSKTKPNKFCYTMPKLMDGLKVKMSIDEKDNKGPGKLGIDLGANFSIKAEYEQDKLAGKICADLGETDKITLEGATEVKGAWIGGEAVVNPGAFEGCSVGIHYQLGDNTQIDFKADVLENIKKEQKLNIKVHQKYSDTGEVAVEYDMDMLQSVESPMVSIGGRWELDEKCTTQAVLTVNGPTYLLYKHKLSDHLTASLGTSFNLPDLQNANVNVHYKLEMEA